MRRNPIYSTTTDSQNSVGLALTTGGLHAALYGSDGMEIEWTQPDGANLSLRVIGDEFYARAEPPHGYTVLNSGSYVGLTILVLFPDDPATTKIPNSRQINF